MSFLETTPIVIDVESPNGKFEYEPGDAFPLFRWFARDRFIATCDLIA